MFDINESNFKSEIRWWLGDCFDLFCRLEENGYILTLDNLKDILSVINSDITKAFEEYTKENVAEKREEFCNALYDYLTVLNPNKPMELGTLYENAENLESSIKENPNTYFQAFLKD